ncbi:MAG: glycosyl hydrolase 53 family protein [Candidatus Pedobacter colombiensis]|uniref:Arabinogalactan endo-beta-1,4-galactanase n=1 Tax=Candidatus Pedobacter colombiensis TaxID=3121371 RepID=A0AAJ5WAJ0_9SPHI|nr:glycosyl hydrolase 53 family protein [Pedobacter sp.]WEK21037.1 MAG: glycosyl hydrolase 53 family protein [Pedobacter sp.]
MRLKSIHITQSLGLLFLIFLLMTGCKKSPKGDTQIYPVPDPPGTYAKGADVSWVTEMEAGGKKFYNNAGVEQDLFKILSDKGINSIRLRVWVNPTGGWCNTADVVAKAKRAKAMNMRVMLDFHYSDNWADPGKQTKPAAWATQSIAALKTSVYDHTVAVLTALKDNKIVPEWVQVGNETNNGMLWDEGKASLNMKNFADLVLSGYSAVKFASPTSKVIVHISNGYDNALFRWMFDGLKNNGAKWDVIGMSLYPSATDWATKNTQCLANMTDMVARYGSEIMICEIGMPVAEAEASKLFIADLLTKNKSLPNNKGLGVFYWEPESYNSWSGYKLGAFDDTGKPTVALNAFLP